MDCEEEGNFSPATPILFDIFLQQENEAMKYWSFETTLQGILDELLGSLQQSVPDLHLYRIHRLHQAYPKNPVIRCESIGIVFAQDLSPYAVCIVPGRTVSEDFSAFFKRLEKENTVRNLFETHEHMKEEELNHLECWMFGREARLDAGVNPLCGVIVEARPCRKQHRFDPNELLEAPQFEIAIEEEPAQVEDAEFAGPEFDAPFTDERLWESEAFRLLVQES